MTCDAESLPITLAVCGDPVTCKALVLLLRSSRYEPRFLAVSSLEPKSLKGIKLLLLTPEPSAVLGESDFATLRRMASSAGIPTLELVNATTLLPEQDRQAQIELVTKVPWPCSSEKLRQQIDAKLLRGNAVPGLYPSSLIAE